MKASNIRWESSLYIIIYNPVRKKKKRGWGGGGGGGTVRWRGGGGGAGTSLVFVARISRG